MISRKYTNWGSNYRSTKKYDRAVDFLVNEYLPGAAKGIDDLIPAYEFLAQKFCEYGNLFGFKLVFGKMTVTQTQLNAYLKLSCINPNIQLSEFIIAAGADNIAKCFMSYETHTDKYCYLAEKCYEYGILPISDILYRAVHMVRGTGADKLRNIIPFEIDHINDAFVKAVGDGYDTSAETLIGLGCTNYDKKLYAMGIYATFG